jgi:1-acyl-sn-glycerol-3-phosphate acyltransferase
MKSQEYLPWWVRLNRRWMRPLFRALFHVLGKVELSGMENIPANNRYVIAFNHVSMVEIPLIAAFWPVPIEIIGADVVWERPGQNIIAVLWSAIRVKRTEFDREVFNQVEKVFAAGRPLMISPEGTRSHTPGLQRGKPGVAYIIDKVDVDVLPVGVVGNTMEFLHEGLRGKRLPIQMYVGEPFRLLPLEGKGADRRDMRQNNTDYIMAKVAALLPESYRGVYREYEKILAGERVQFE